MVKNSKDHIKKEINDLIFDAKYILYLEAYNKKSINKEEMDKLDSSEDFNKFRKNIVSINISYQAWYSKVLRVLSQIQPERVTEFINLYILDKRNVKDIDILTYTISDYFLGLTVTKGWEKVEVLNPFSTFMSKIQLQIAVLHSCLDIIDSKLSDIEGFLQSELFDSELSTAKDILKKKHVRLAGALAGITLEVHLKKVCKNHSVDFRKANPTISDFNEELKKLELIDLPTWRLIQRLGDIRNMSVHSKEREPTSDEIEDLIRGTEKLIAEIY